MTPTFTTYLIGPLIDNFTKSFPGIQISVQEMTQDKIETSLAEDALDESVESTSA
jgi:LysR family cyn operon transcriptional activator